MTPPRRTQQRKRGRPGAANDRPRKAAKKLRLLKVHVQPVFVLDDGESMVEVAHPTVTIPAADWPTYSSDRFPAERAAWEAKLNEEG